jgi:GTP-binding protein EngB required for normal cell division
VRRSLTLQDRLERLDRLVELGDGRLEPELLDLAREVRSKAAQRLARGDGSVVVALCGGTGVGKSSLFNALAGRELSPVGARRPVTTDPRALVVGEDPASASLLDWLGVDDRHHVPAGREQGLPEGVVVVDLPDHDSVALDHRLIVDDFVDRVDVLVWVVDPVKYAHASLHEGYLHQLASHAEVVIAVLNRADELSPDARGTVVEDLRRLLAVDGLVDVRIVTTSARTGEGVEELRRMLATEGEERRAVVRRLTADLQHLAGDVTGPALGERTAGLPPTAGLVDALATAVGIEPTAEASAAEYRLDARTGSRSLVVAPFAAVLAMLLRPIRGLRGLFDRSGRQRRQRASGQAGGATPLTVRHAALRLLEDLLPGLPERWGARLQLIAGAEDGRLVRQVRTAVDAVPLRPPRRRWWRVFAVLRTLIDAVAAVGAIWLLLLALLAWLRLPEPPTPMVTEVLSVPTALLLGALVVRFVVGLVDRILTAVGARRHHRAVARALQRAVEDVVAVEVAEPLTSELETHAELRRLVTELSA